MLIASLYLLNLKAPLGAIPERSRTIPEGDQASKPRVASPRATLGKAHPNDIQPRSGCGPIDQQNGKRFGSGVAVYLVGSNSRACKGDALFLQGGEAASCFSTNFSLGMPPLIPQRTHEPPLRIIPINQPPQPAQNRSFFTSASARLRRGRRDPPGQPA